MKRTIKNIVCDTNKATYLGGKSVEEFGNPYGFEEQLFITEGGQHFLYGVGGPDSPYKNPVIKLFSNEKAEDWKNENNIS